MSYYGWGRYVPVAEKKAKAKKLAAKMQKKGKELSPVEIEGSKIAKSWWATAWNKNLESYSDYANRIGRGRTYVRNGSVIHLDLSKGKADAIVAGSSPYNVSVTIKPMSEKDIDTLSKKISGSIDSMHDLLQGKFPKEFENLLKDKKSGLFPSPKEIDFDCDCPDWASMCKHIAAVLYGIGSRFDDNPELFFTLRNIPTEKLLTKSLHEETDKIINSKKKSKRKILSSNNEISSLFGISMDIGFTDTNKKSKKKEKSTTTSKAKKKAVIRKKST